MPTHDERRIIGYTPDQLYALVADVEHYPEFLPSRLRTLAARHQGRNSG